MIGLVAVLLAVGLSGMGRPIAFDTPPSRPNIILILTDDQTVDQVPFMPRLKGLLIEQGTTFTNFFVTDSVCCPSRSSILRGQYVHNHQVLTNSPPDGGFLRFRALGNENSTIATWLQAAGYRTILVGKYLNGYDSGDDPTYVPPGWDEWYAAVGGTPSPQFCYNYQLNENGHVVAYDSRPEDYITDVLSSKAIDFIRRSANDARPFFMYLAPYAPHLPACSAPRHQNQFADVKAPRRPSFNEEDVSDKPEWVRRQPLLSPGDFNLIDARYRNQLRSLLAVDEMLASIIKVLQVIGKLESTYIFFTSDNGFHMGEHRLLGGKETAYEEDIRVPLIVRGPGVLAGRVLEHFALNIDFAPTFAELVGASVPEFVDGRSLVPLLSSNSPPLSDWRQALLVEHWPEPQDDPVIPEYQALRTKNYLYVEYTTSERELYDLHSDPYELQSLHATADHALIAQLSSFLAELRRCAGASCRTAERALDMKQRLQVLLSTK